MKIKSEQVYHDIMYGILDMRKVILKSMGSLK